MEKKAWFDALKEDYHGTSARIRREHFDGAGGMHVVRENTAMKDRLVGAVFERAREEAGLPAETPGWALVAVGGYGRAELNPYSDVDIMFLCREMSSGDERFREFPTSVLHTLWDLGLDLGHSVRGIDDCCSLMWGDFTIMTSLLEARYLCGDRGVFDEFSERLDVGKRPRVVEDYIRTKLSERARRHREHGGSVFLREPNIKEGAGGLRDIHAAVWIARMKYGVGELEGLAGIDIIRGKDFRRLKGCRDYLLRLRNELHYLSGYRQDVLTFELQEKAANDFGYAARSNRMPVENFMRAYFLRARGVAEITQGIIERSLRASAGRRWFFIPPRRRKLDGDFYVMGRAVCMEGISQDELRTRPELIMAALSHSQAQGVPMSDNLRELVSENVRAIDRGARTSPAVCRTFLEILGRPWRLYETLDQMHRTKVLGRFIPEFGAVSALVQHDLYHKYTVDEHSLFAVRNVQRLLAADGLAYPEYREAFLRVEDKEVLFLAILLHDVGKALGPGHSATGADLAYSVAVRLGMEEDRARDVEFLVRNHLLMAQTSQRRELTDPKVIESFCGVVGKKYLLEMLFLLTYADVSAVGPELFNDWKRMLMKDLYERATSYLVDKVSLAELQNRRVQELGGRLAGMAVERSAGTAAQVGEFLSNLPARYLLSVPLNTALRHFELSRGIKGGDVIIEHEHDERGYTNLTVILHDVLGLFYITAGALAAKNMNILSGKIFTGRDGIIIDTLQVTDFNKKPAFDDALWKEVKEGLKRVLTGRASVENLLPSRPAYPKRTVLKKSPVRVIVDNEASDRYTVIEVYAPDRVGLLFDITRVLYTSGCYIYSAMVDTSVDQVVDVFYVSDIFRQKIHDVERIGQLKASLKGAVTGSD